MKYHERVTCSWLTAEETRTRGAHPVARKYAGVLARGLRPRAGGGWHTRCERGLFSEEATESE